MCGILAILGIDPARSNPEELRKQALVMAKQLRHRGPDWSGIFSDGNAILAHERLSIVDVEHGAQPLLDTVNGNALTVNGEIYNHKALRAGLTRSHDFQTFSDCEVILYLYDEGSPMEWLNRMNGIFAFVIYDPRNATFMIARDPIGVVPLYVGWDRQENLYAASEMKALVGHCERIQEFPPGCFYLGHEPEKGFQRYYQPNWAEPGFYPETPYDPGALRKALEDAVHRQLMCDVPYGLLISGGVDSSLVAAIAARYREKRVEEDDQSPAWWPQIHSFAVGLKGAPDLAPARKVADYIGAIHHEIHFTVQEGLDALSDVIYHLESFDVTTVRASTPMYLLMRKIHAMGIKMVLSGEGADEIFGGYLYFHKAPDGRELHDETVRKLDKLHLYDCLRANKSSAAWSVEARVPFLDREFLDVAMNMDPVGQAAAQRRPPQADREVRAAQRVPRLHPGRDPVAPEGAVLRRRGLQLDQLPEGHRREGDHRRHDARRRRAVPGEDPGDQGSLPLPPAVRDPLPPGHRHQLRALRAQRGLLHRDRPEVGRGLPEDGRPLRSRRHGRPRRGLLEIHGTS